MKTRLSKLVRDYIKYQYKGGLIGISSLAEYCHVSEGKLYKILFEMESHNELKIIKRYFCPEFHLIRKENINNQKAYCEECDYSYPNEQLDLVVYIQPLHTKVIR